MTRTTASAAALRGGLSVDAIRFRYPHVEGLAATDLLDGASLCVPEGAAGVILGAADTGKTTLTRILSGLVPRFTGGRLQGSATFGSFDLLALKPSEAMNMVGLVFQDPDEQLITTRCDSEAAFALESLGVPRREIGERISIGLRLMGLESLHSRNPGTLSGGEKKRLLVACLAAIDPMLWILDEVFQELDQAWRETLLDHLARGRRTALFFDSRWSPLYEIACREIAVLAGGRIVDAPSPAMIAGRPAAVDPMGDAGLVLPREPFPKASRGTELFLKADNVTFTFPGPSAFELDVGELSLERGEITALVGKNGSGKSTLGKILCGLLMPERGRISLRRGGTFEPANQRALQQRVAYLFQNPDYQVFLPTVAEELAFGLRAGKRDSAGQGEKVQEAIRLFRLPPGGAPPALLSYGARRRLQAATYYLLDRDLLILDEIDSGLGYRDFLELLPLIAAGGRGILLVTHDMELARYVASRVLVMDGGKITDDRHALAAASTAGLAGTG